MKSLKIALLSAIQLVLASGLALGQIANNANLTQSARDPALLPLLPDRLGVRGAHPDHGQL